MGIEVALKSKIAASSASSGGNSNSRVRFLLLEPCIYQNSQNLEPEVISLGYAAVHCNFKSRFLKISDFSNQSFVSLD